MRVTVINSTPVKKILRLKNKSSKKRKKTFINRKTKKEVSTMRKKTTGKTHTPARRTNPVVYGGHHRHHRRRRNPFQAPGASREGIMDVVITGAIAGGSAIAVKWATHFFNLTGWTKILVQAAVSIAGGYFLTGVSKNLAKGVAIGGMTATAMEAFDMFLNGPRPAVAAQRRNQQAPVVQITPAPTVMNPNPMPVIVPPTVLRGWDDDYQMLGALTPEEMAVASYLNAKVLNGSIVEDPMMGLIVEDPIMGNGDGHGYDYAPAY